MPAYDRLGFFGSVHYLNVFSGKIVDGWWDTMLISCVSIHYQCFSVKHITKFVKT